MPTDDTAIAPSTRAQELRASLTARLDVETLLAQASAARQAAVADADAILAEAQQVAEQLVSDSRRQAGLDLVRSQEQADGMVAQARADAEAVRARAEAEVEGHRRRVRDEVTAQVTHEVQGQARAELTTVREQTAAMIGDLEASVRILAVALETAQANVAELLSAVGDLRIHTVEGLADPAAGQTDARTGELTEGLGDAPVASPLTRSADDEDRPDEDRPDEDRPDEDRPDEDGPADGGAPRTALEAYLRSYHLDHDDPPLPTVDDTQVGLRYAHEAQVRRVGALGDPADVAPAAASRTPDLHEAQRGRTADRPLGWLFRNSP